MEHPKPIDLSGNDFDINDIDKAVKSRCHLKDPNLKIIGLKKETLGKQDGFKIFKVNREWLNNNLDVTFGTGGHGLVHSYIPMDEIWIDPVVEKKESLIKHEITEHLLMKKKGVDYKDAHKETGKTMQDNKENNLIKRLAKRKKGE